MREQRLRSWVEALCSDECDGRAAGTPGGAAARRIIVDGLRAAGLAPELQPIEPLGGANVWARAGSGAGPAVIVGAHYDHLGRDGEHLFRGADDNAAAVALLVELAGALAAAPPAAGEVWLVAFDAEEPPHFRRHDMGSATFVRRPPLALERVGLAIILDLVGHAIGPPGAPAAVRDSLFALGAEKSQGTGELVARAAAGVSRLAVRRASVDVIPPLSDYDAFREAGVPFLFLSCGRWRHYHAVSDTPDRLDFGKLAATTAFVERAARLALERPRPAYDDRARDHAGTVAALLDLARALAAVNPRAAAMARSLEAIRSRTDPERGCALGDWSTVLQMVALLEQGLA